MSLSAITACYRQSAKPDNAHCSLPPALGGMVYSTEPQCGVGLKVRSSPLDAAVILFFFIVSSFLSRYNFSMSVTQTVEIPVSYGLTIDAPLEDFRDYM